MLIRASLIFALLMSTPLWSQVDTNSTEPASPTNDTAMITPPPVSGQTYPNTPASELRSNYLRYGLTFNTAYSDNVPSSAGTNPVSDESYSIAPTIALDETTSTLHTVLSYSPGFTFYQHTSGLNAADQNGAIDVQYRLSPHLTLTGRDTFQKSSSVFNQPNWGSGAVSGGAQGSNSSAIAPFADLLTNTGNVGLQYQFAANGVLAKVALSNGLPEIWSA